MFECINKLRSSKFWMALEASAKPNTVNRLFMSNEMVKDITAAKNVFGHQASGGVCNKGDGGLCVCRALMDRLFEYAKDSQYGTEQALLRLVCANIPSGIELNFPEHGQLISEAVSTFLVSNPGALQSFEPRADPEASQAKAKVPDKPRSRPTKKSKTKDKVDSPSEEIRGTPFFNPNFSPGFNPSTSFASPPFGMPSSYCSASVHVTHTSYGPNHVQRIVANFSVGGVPMNDLFNQLNSLFAPR